MTCKTLIIFVINIIRSFIFNFLGGYMEKEELELKKELSIEELEAKFKTNLEGGLTDYQIDENRLLYGVNELKDKKKIPIWIKFLTEFKDPLIIILILAAIISINPLAPIL